MWRDKISEKLFSYVKVKLHMYEFPLFEDHFAFLSLIYRILLL